MKRFNLSAWAVAHPPLVLFLIVALGLAGFFSYQKLGRAEDPFFTVKVVNVTVLWPGATANDIQTQVADPIEKKMQELVKPLQPNDSATMQAQLFESPEGWRAAIQPS